MNDPERKPRVSFMLTRRLAALWLHDLDTAADDFAGKGTDAFGVLDPEALVGGVLVDLRIVAGGREPADAVR